MPGPQSTLPTQEPQSLLSFWHLPVPLHSPSTELGLVEGSLQDSPGLALEDWRAWKEGIQIQSRKECLGACWGTELHRSEKGGTELGALDGRRESGGSKDVSAWGTAWAPPPLFQEPVVAGSGLGVPKSGLAGKSFQLRTGNPWPSSWRDDTPRGPGLVRLRMLSLRKCSAALAFRSA